MNGESTANVLEKAARAVLADLAAPNQISSAQGSSDNGESKAMTKVVVVDDDPDIRELVVMKLGRAGYHVIAEADGEAGLAATLEEQPALVVLDWMMPGLTGIEVCLALREDPRTTGTAVLLLTARAQEADIERGFAAGADDYLVKPFSVRELVSRVDAMVSRVR